MPRAINVAPGSSMTLPKSGATQQLDSAAVAAVKPTLRCENCKQYTRLYAAECVKCYKCICEECNRRQFGLMSLTPCCRNKYCRECPDDVRQDCDACDRRGCTVCIDVECRICNYCLCDACYGRCVLCEALVCVRHFDHTQKSAQPKTCINCVKRAAGCKRARDDDSADDSDGAVIDLTDGSVVTADDADDDADADDADADSYDRNEIKERPLYFLFLTGAASVASSAPTSRKRSTFLTTASI
jgi:hypothetical protein